MLREDDSFRGYRKGTLDLNGVMILPILLMNDQVKQMSKRNFTLSQSGKPKFGLQELFFGISLLQQRNISESPAMMSRRFRF